MRVWLVDDRAGDDPDGLEARLKQLALRPECGLQLTAARSFWPNFALDLRARRPDVVVVRDSLWPDDPWAQDVLALGPAVVVATSPAGCERLRGLAEFHPLLFVPACPTLEDLWLALLSAAAAMRRHACVQTEIARLQQRLSDRIIIERAKGILVQRLNITEEEAYKRLRVLSRRQRRQIRDIAQSLLDTQSLLLPEANGFLGEHEGAENGRDDEKPFPPV